MIACQWCAQYSLLTQDKLCKACGYGTQYAQSAIKRTDPVLDVIQERRVSSSPFSVHVSAAIPVADLELANRGGHAKFFR